MKSVVVYDSLYGNTELIAKAIGETLDCNVYPVEEFNLSNLQSTDLLVIGSPVHGGRPTPIIDQFISSLPEASLHNLYCAVFDTRFEHSGHSLGIKIVLSVIRFAAERMEKAVTRKGGRLLVKPQGFIVEDKEGPLKAGELDKAALWASMMKRIYSRKMDGRYITGRIAL